MTKFATRMPSLSMRGQLLLATFLLCLSLVLAAFWSANLAVKSAARTRFVATAQQTVHAMQEASQNRVAGLDQGTAAAMHDPIFRAQLSRLRQSDAAFGLGESDDTSETGEAHQRLAEVHDFIASADLPYFKSYPLFVLGTQEKQLLFNRFQPGAHGTTLNDWPLLDTAQQQGTAFGFLPGDSAPMRALGADPAELYLVIAKKIEVAGQNLGYVLVGEPVRQGLLADLDRVSQANTGIALGTRVWSRDAKAQAVAQDFLAGAGRVDGEDFTWSEMAYFVRKTDSGLVLVKAIHEELALLDVQLRLRFLEFIVPLALLALALAAGMAQFFSGPIVALTLAVRAVKSGNYAAKMPTRRGDEVGELARAFNDMTESLSALRIDPLTGLYSEQYLKDTLAFELMYSATHSRPLALVNLRWFDFEKTLAELGDDAARDALLAFAEHLSARHKRIEDVAARGEEDEFWLLLVGADLGAAKAICQSILADHHPAIPKLVMGLAVFNLHVGEVDGFMALARDAAEEARRSGPAQLGLALGIGTQ